MHAENETIGMRLKMVRETLGYTQSGIADAVGSKLRSWQDYERGGHFPGSQVIAGLVKLGINANWVLAGIGSMRISDSNCVEEPLASYQVNKSEFAFIPLFDVEACAGDGSYVDHESVKQELPFRRDWFSKEVAANPAHVHLIYVRGDSMAPDLKDGEIVMVNTAMNGALVRDDIYVVRIDDTIAVKMLSRLPGGRVKVMSKNQDYGSFETDLENIHIIGQVIWHAGRV